VSSRPSHRDQTAGPDALRALSVQAIMQRAYERHVLVPAFNIAYLPMVEPIAKAVAAASSFALIEVARPEIERFGAESYAAVAAEFGRCADRACLRLHQDHVPAVDEDGRQVDWRTLIQQALDLGYDSVMVDGSRLPLRENIAVTAAVVEMSHPAAAVEAELGAVLGHEAGPLPPYEELFRSGRGFTDPGEAEQFVRETGVDWLSVAVGNIHGAIQGAAQDQEKVRARLDLAHLGAIASRTGIPLVLHGGSGIPAALIREATGHGIGKINIGFALRQAYGGALREGRGTAEARRAVARVTLQHIEEYGLRDSAKLLAARSER